MSTSLTSEDYKREGKVVFWVWGIPATILFILMMDAIWFGILATHFPSNSYARGPEVPLGFFEKIFASFLIFCFYAYFFFRLWAELVICTSVGKHVRKVRNFLDKQ